MEPQKSWYLKCSKEDVAKQVVLVGDPARVQLFAQQMDDAQIVAQAREFTTMTGTYNGIRMSVVSVGIGAPSVAIVLEELWELGVRVIIRAGTAIALNVPPGHFILASGAVRHEGVSSTYLPLEFPAICDADLLFAFRETMKAESVPHATGLVATSDGFYTHLFEHVVPGRKSLPRQETLIEQFTSCGVLGTDMESSAVYVVGRFLGLKTLSVLVTTVDGKTSTMLKSNIRREKEKQLARLVLKGLHHAVSERIL